MLMFSRVMGGGRPCRADVLRPSVWSMTSWPWQQLHALLLSSMPVRAVLSCGALL